LGALGKREKFLLQLMPGVLPSSEGREHPRPKGG
jgi:hypothetical protein